VLVAHHLPAVGVPQAEVAGIDAGEDLPDELRPGHDCQVNRRRRVPQHVDAVGHANFPAQFADDAGHGGGGDRLDAGQVRQAGLVGEHDGVDAAIL